MLTLTPMAQMETSANDSVSEVVCSKWFPLIVASTESGTQFDGLYERFSDHKGVFMVSGMNTKRLIGQISEVLYYCTIW